MKKGIIITMGLLAWAVVAQSAEISPEIAANNDIVEGRILIGDPNEGRLGAFIQWNDRMPDHVWGLGGVATYDVTETGRTVLDTILDPPASWFELLDALGGKVYLVGKVGAVNLVEEPTAYASPGIGVGLGPLFFEQEYAFIEGGGLPDVAEGYSWMFGLRKVFTF